MKPPPQSLIAVDLTRFACAAMVVCYHYLTTRWLEPSPEAAVLLAGVLPPADRVIASGRFGWIGVQLFFVISGMLIAQSAENSRPLAFIRRRLLRLAPAVLVCGTTTMLVLAMAGQGDGGLLLRLLRSLIFWPFGRQIDPSYWTLAIELSFYALVAVMMRGAKPTAIENTARLLVAWSGAFWVIVAARDAAGYPIKIEMIVNLALLSHGSFFAIGMLFTVVARRGLTRPRAVAIVAAIVIGCAQIQWMAKDRSAILHVSCEAWVAILLFLVGLVILACAWRAQPILARLIPAGTARVIGLATYPLYLLHQEAGTVVIALLARSGMATLPALMVTALLAMTAAGIVAAWCEPAARRGLAAALDAAGRRMTRLRRRSRPALQT